MIRMKQFYSLIERGAAVTLTTEEQDGTLYAGPLKSIPDAYDSWEVKDFSVSSDGRFSFRLARPQEEGWFQVSAVDRRTGGYRDVKVYIPAREDEE